MDCVVLKRPVSSGTQRIRRTGSLDAGKGIPVPAPIAVRADGEKHMEIKPLAQRGMEKCISDVPEGFERGASPAQIFCAYFEVCPCAKQPKRKGHILHVRGKRNWDSSDLTE